MASGGHMLQQSRMNLEARIKTLINSDLKEICKAYGYQVSGTKAVLQKRCFEILSDIVGRGDTMALEDLRYRLNNRGASPQLNRLDSPSNSYPTPGSYQSYNMAPQRGGGGLPDPRLLKGGKYFKPSPFYEVLETIMPLQDLPDDPEMPQNRHTVRVNLTISPDLAQQFRNPSSNLKILIYCGMAHSMSPFSPTDVAFPNQIEVKVNEVDAKANFKGLKNKPGSTKPADITGLVRKFGEQQNEVQITYALTTKRYAYVIYLAKYIDAKTLTTRIKNGNIIPRQKVLDDMNRANADPDIAATSIRMSLKDPISTMRITLPVRSSHCTHNQCFDGAMFLQLQEQAPQWSCPVCNKSVAFESLCIDKYFEDILNRTPKAIEKVDIEPNGNWTVIKEEEEDEQPNGTKPRASYDDDFDDEIVELDQPSSRQLNGLRNESQPSLMLSPIGPAFSMSTPPLSSREPSVAQSTSSAHRLGSKRTQGAVIDLTLSDDDDPPRPAKRQSTHHPHNHATQSRDTPTSFPDRTFQPHQNYTHSNQSSDATYRPTSNHSQAPIQQSFFGSTATQNMPSPSNPPQSPLRASPYSQPVWPAQHSRQQPAGNNNNNSFQPRSPFAIRPPSAASSSSGIGGGGGGQQQGGLRLPPMQTTQQQQQVNSSDYSSYPGSWRNDFGGGSFSQSPG